MPGVFLDELRAQGERTANSLRLRSTVTTYSPIYRLYPNSGKHKV